MEKMLHMLSLCVFIVSLLNFSIHHVNGFPPTAIGSRCNCIRARDCVPFTTELLTTHKEELGGVIARIRNAGCGFSAFSEPMVCCPSITNSFDFTNHHLNSAKDRWIWDRRPKASSKKSSEVHVEVENKFVKDENRLIRMNLIDDYVDWKTHRNCPPILFKEMYHDYHKNFRGHHLNSDHDQHSFYHHHDHDQHAHHPNDRFEFDEHTAPNGFHRHIPYHNHFDEYDFGSNDEGIIHSGSNHAFWPAEFPTSQEPRSRDKPETTTTKSTTFADSTPTQRASPPRRLPTTRPTVNAPNCGVTLNKRIIGGIDALPGEFPWISRIAYQNRTDNSIAYRCSGSFVSELHIVTAAHCVTNLDTSISLSHIRLVEANGNSNCNNQNQPCPELQNLFQITETIVHPNYDNPKRANDIAIIKINKPPNTALNYGTICLPNAQLNNNLNGSTGIVAGWANNEGTETSDLRVRYLRLSIMNNTDCAERYNIFREGFADKITIVSSMVCTQGQSNGSDVCRGDSGGPLMDDNIFDRDGRYTLIGIVAFGPICGFANLLPGVYMRISEYVDWIISNIK